MTAFRGIRGKPFFDFSPQVNLATLQALRPQILEGISRSEIYLAELGSRVHPFEKNLDPRAVTKYPETYDKHRVSLLREVESVAGREGAILFTKLAFGTVTSLMSCPLRVSASFADRARPEQCHWLEHQTRHFPKALFEFFESLPFEQIARVTFFIREHHCKVGFHRDDEPIEHESEFLWFHITGDASLELLSADGQERIVLPKSAVFFNERDYHGVSASPEASVSLRVDGIFTTALRERLGFAPPY